MKNRTFKVFLILLSVIFLLCSCGNGSDEKTKQSETKDKTSATESTQITTETEKKPYSEYETYTDTDGKKVIKLLEKDSEKKYEKFQYDELTVEELRDIANETLLMFRDFDRIVVDLNQFGDVQKKNVSPPDVPEAGETLKYKVDRVFKDDETVMQISYRDKKRYTHDLEGYEKEKEFFKENMHYVKDGVVTIENATISAYRDPDIIAPKNTGWLSYDYLIEQQYITMIRIWYYLGMPPIYFSDSSSPVSNTYYIFKTEGIFDYEHYKDWVIRMTVYGTLIEYREYDINGDPKYYKLLDFESVYGDPFALEPGYVPNLPINYGT